jgi:hypothetical protein
MRNAWNAYLDSMKVNFVVPLVAVVQSDVPLIESTTGQLVGSTSVTEATISATGGGEALPRFSQLLCQLRTGNVINGRRLRGRIFLPGMQETTNTSLGKPSSALVTSNTGALETMRAAVAPRWVVYSRTNKAFGIVTSVGTWGEWASLRSRRD